MDELDETDGSSTGFVGNIDERDDHTCQQCGEMDPESPEVDHIQRIADGGHPLEEPNLQTLCKDCHTEKTVDENSSRGTAPDVTLSDYLET